MKKLFLYIWQLPQHLLALFILKLINRGITIKEKWFGYYVYYVKYGVFKNAVSLGNYIILHKSFMLNNNTIDVIKHKVGHSKQSLIFGWFYLLLVGLPSVINNITDMLFHKKWDYEKRRNWYFSQYPEKWADKLGGVFIRRW